MTGAAVQDKTSWAKCNKFTVTTADGRAIRVIHKTAKRTASPTHHYLDFIGEGVPTAHRQYVTPDVAPTPRAFAERHLAELTDTTPA